jgi:hypothetical protein
MTTDWLETCLDAGLMIGRREAHSAAKSPGNYSRLLHTPRDALVSRPTVGSLVSGTGRYRR